MSKKAINYVLLACCTCKRPKLFSACINSINDLKIPNDIKVEILVIDNDENEGALSITNDFCVKSGIKCHYFCEQQRGLAHARNRLLTEAINLGASHIMMFDDDEILTSNALLEHVNLSQKYDEPIVSSGLVVNKFEKNTPNYIKKNIVFKQKSSKKTGQEKKYCAGGNVFFPTEMIKDSNLRFSSEYIFMGGEDGDFFSRAYENGYKIIQNSESILYELVINKKSNKSRASLNYIFRKSYYNGFSGSFLKFKNNNKKAAKVFYVFKQIITFILDLLIVLPALLLGITGFVNCISMAIRAFGKIKGAISKKPIDFYQEVYGE